jgi:hypothetical protein
MNLDAATFSERVRASTERRLREGDRLFLTKGITIEEVRIETNDADYDLVVLFREDARPECMLGRRWSNIWAMELGDEKDLSVRISDEEAVEGFVTLFIVNLDEEIEAVDLGLPSECDPDSVTWI